MVKLLKHELYALFRILGFLAVAVVLFAALSRLLIGVNLSNQDNAADHTQLILLILVIFFYIIAICALVAAAWWLGITRFYKTLFTGEGYMTLSLPVSSDALIGAKILSALIGMFFASIVSAGSLCIFLLGWNNAIMESVGVFFEDLFSTTMTNVMGDPLYFAEEIVLQIVTIPFSLLLVYAFISLGQLFTNHRVGMTLLIAAGVYIVWSFFEAWVYTPFERWVILNLSWGGVHLTEWIKIVFLAAMDVLCYFLVRYILRNKVNLIA